MVIPLEDRVLIKKKESSPISKGGIIIPDNAQEKTQEGLVVQIGNNMGTCPVVVGDNILFDKYAGTSISINGKEHLILKVSDLIAILVGDNGN